jgi:Asp-tRNA(Asn)/Glu-tRNA(Gln) amidotransferase A subunit family amidase
MHGVVPIDATYRDVVGPIARTVQDAAIALDVLAGPSNKDLASYAGVGHIPEGGYANALNPTSLAGKRFGLVGLGWRTQFLPLAPETEAEYQKAIAALKARGAEVVEDPFAGTGWIQAYQTNRGGGGGTAGAHDMLVYLMNLGPNAAFHSIEEWEKLTGREMGGGRGGNPTTPTATEAGDAFGAWRMNIRALFRKVMTDNRLDGLFFPQAGAPITMLVEDPSQPAPNNHPELPSNIINDVGLPVVTVPFSYYADGTPFVIAFIGDMWTEPQLLGYAYDFEQATKGRRPPTLVPKPTR